MRDRTNRDRRDVAFCRSVIAEATRRANIERQKEKLAKELGIKLPRTEAEFRARAAGKEI